MTLAIPANIANRDDTASAISAILDSLPGPVTYHVLDGVAAGARIDANEYIDASHTIANCSLVYALDGIHGLREPVAGFVGNESLGTAKLLYLIDDRPPASNGKIPRRTMEMLGVYIRSLYADNAWVQRVTVPSNVELLDGLFDLRVLADDVSCITLVDAVHRPHSARYGG